MDKESALRKIQKCLALSKSSEPHEAANAMRQAQALMRQFDIDHPELLAAGVSSDWTKSRATRRPPTYEVHLAHVVAEAFGCDLIWSGRWVSRTYAGGYLFIGGGASAQVAAYSFAVLGRKLIAARSEYTTVHLKRYRRNKIAAADAFCDGWVLGVQQAVLPNPPDADQRAAIDAFRLINHPDIAEKPLATTSRALADTRRADDHADSGWREGKKAQLHAGVGGGPAQQLALL